MMQLTFWDWVCYCGGEKEPLPRGLIISKRAEEEKLKLEVCWKCMRIFLHGDIEPIAYAKLERLKKGGKGNAIFRR